MAAMIRFEDGRGLWGSNLSVDAMLTLIARHVSDEFPDFRTWLADKAGRPAPFLDTDLGGLEPSHLREFYVAAARAYESLLAEDPNWPRLSNGVQLLGHMLEMRLDGSSDFDHILDGFGPEDLTELWEV